MAEPTQEDIDAFTANIKHMVNLQERLKEIALVSKEQRGPVKDQFENTKLEIITFMKKGGIDVCNYQDEKIELQVNTRYGSLTRKTLRTGLASYFNNEDEAQACFDHILGTLGTKEVDNLRRVRSRKRTRTAKPAAVPSVDESTAPVLQDDSDEEA